MTRLTHEKYTIGWICALRDELTAAIAMLDEEHEQLSKHHSDTNSYQLGRIGNHNIVLAGLPNGWTGKESAAIVATNLQSTFRNIRYGLMVGVGGAAPNDENDIRLGDIVVSKPGVNNGAVYQYDYGKTIERGEFIHTGTLNLPPVGLLTAITLVQAHHRLRRYAYIQHLEQVTDQLDVEFARPSTDRQFVADYDHVGKSLTCEDCSAEKVKPLKQRQSPIPRVFYGTIACADEVMRHGETRDKIAKQCGALCFEMEAAGLMNNFPCVVIRGMCDYADTHKNKQWQPYAAVAAAAYAKELLAAVALHDVDKDVLVASKLAESTLPKYVTPAAQSTQTKFEFFSVLNKTVLRSNTVALGRMLLNVHAPWGDFCSSVPRPSEHQIGIVLQDRFRDILKDSQQEQNIGQLSGRLANVLEMELSLTSVDAASEKTYILTDSTGWLKGVCAMKETRLWLEQCIKTGRSVFMIVGIHTASNFPATSEEVIVAVQYQQLEFGWFFRRNVDSATLKQNGNMWLPTFITRGDEEDDDLDEEEILEIRLKNNTERDRLSEEQKVPVGDWRVVL